MAVESLADVLAVWHGDKVKAQIRRATGRGIRAAAIFFSARVKELLSVPATRKSVTGKRGKNAGVRYYRALVPAVPGAPPRKLSGKLRRSITYQVSPEGTAARVGTVVIYARRLEWGSHPFLVPAFISHRENLVAIIGANFKADG